MDDLATAALLVPQGAEYQAVCRGAGRATPTAIAMGRASVAQLDLLLEHPPNRVVLLGLGGSLSPARRPGDVVVYRDCIDQGSEQRLRCDGALYADLCQILNRQTMRAKPLRVTTATGLTSDRVVCSAAEKRQLGQRHGAAVVDMEGFWVLERLQAQRVAVGIVRVISDGVGGDIPDLSQAMGPDGALRPLALTTAMGRSPLSALRLIRGSLQGLSVLRQVATQLQDLT